MLEVDWHLFGKAAGTFISVYPISIWNQEACAQSLTCAKFNKTSAPSPLDIGYNSIQWPFQYLHFRILEISLWSIFFLVKLSKLQVDGVGFRIFPSINAGLRRAGLAVQHAPTPGWMTMGRGLGWAVDPGVYPLVNIQKAMENHYFNR